MNDAQTISKVVASLLARLEIQNERTEAIAEQSLSSRGKIAELIVNSTLAKYLVQDPIPEEFLEALEAFATSWFSNESFGCLCVVASDDRLVAQNAARALWRLGRTVAVQAWELGFWSDVPPVSRLDWGAIAPNCSLPRFRLPTEAMSSSLLILDNVAPVEDASQDMLNRLAQCLARREDKFTLVTTPVLREHWRAAFNDTIAFRLTRAPFAPDFPVPA